MANARIVFSLNNLKCEEQKNILEEDLISRSPERQAEMVPVTPYHPANDYINFTSIFLLIMSFNFKLLESNVNYNHSCQLKNREKFKILFK